MSKESVRQRKVADQIRQAVSMVIDRRLKDPDKGFITITHVKMSRDLSIASVYFTALGSEQQQKKSAAALERAASFIRAEIGPSLKLRIVPELRFFMDDTLAYARKIDRLLDDIKKADDER